MRLLRVTYCESAPSLHRESTDSLRYDCTSSQLVACSTLSSNNPVPVCCVHLSWKVHLILCTSKSNLLSVTSILCLVTLPVRVDYMRLQFWSCLWISGVARTSRMLGHSTGTQYVCTNFCDSVEAFRGSGACSPRKFLESHSLLVILWIIHSDIAPFDFKTV